MSTSLFRNISLLIVPCIVFFSFISGQNSSQAPILQHITPPQSPPKESHRYVITGGPGVGKTSIIHYLRDCGYHVLGEAATDVIRQSLEKGIAKPWDKDYKSDFNRCF